MGGLVEKDLRLIIQRKQVMVLCLVFSVIIGYTQEGNFILGYVPVLMLMLTIGTISYDELDNGFTFLLTLPINTKTYVTEKYIFCGVAGILSWLMSIVIYYFSGVLHGKNVELQAEIPMYFLFLAVFTLMMAFLIPVQLKFGANNSRTVMLVVVGVALILAFFVKRFLGEERIVEIQHMFDEMSDMTLKIVAILVVVLSMIISYICSLRIMKKKEL